MKIAYLVDEIPNLRGSTRYERARYLSEKNELSLFLRKGSRVPEEIHPKITIIRSGCESVAWHLFWRLYQVWRMDKKVHFDFVYTFHSPFSIIEGFFLRLMGLRWIADVWDLPEQVLEAEGERFWHRLTMKASVILARRFLKHADLVICGIMPEALHTYHIESAKTLSVTNGVELEFIKPRGNKRSHDKFSIFYVGPLHWVRGIDILLAAVNSIRNEVPAKLVLAGRVYEDFQGWLSDYISKHDLGDTVETLGQIEHEKVIDLMEKADVCVCPLSDTEARRYAYPIKVLQYLATGKAVVATNLPGVAQFIEHGENGLLVSPSDWEEMAEAILRIYRDKELREKLEHNARPSVLQYDWSTINEKIGNALSALLTS